LKWATISRPAPGRRTATIARSNATLSGPPETATNVVTSHQQSGDQASIIGFSTVSRIDMVLENLLQ
jgi:hypothetical protein